MERSWTVRDLLVWTSKHFAKQGIEAARLEAELLLAHALGQDRVWLYMHYDRPCNEEERESYRELIRRRVQGEPYAYITGSREFMSLEFSVTRDVLIPRPDTETLAELAIDLARREELRHICDIGTGSGAIAVSMAYYLPDAELVATDISPQALALARANAEKHHVALKFFEADLLNHSSLYNFDLIVANLPYVTEEQWRDLSPGVRDFEPRLALVAAGDGLELYRRLMVQAEQSLRPGGWIMLEIDPRQSEAATQMLHAFDYKKVELLKDRSGHNRVVLGHKPMRTSVLKPERGNVGDVLKAAAGILSSGELLAFPTETVYGLGASVADRSAIRKIYRVKGRPSSSGLLVHISHIEQAEAMAKEITLPARSLMENFWPGPLAIILDAVEGLPSELTGNKSSIGFRMPAHPLALALIDQAGPLAAPSANLHGRPSPLTAEHVMSDLEGKISGILDGGPTGGGVESTIIDLSAGKCEILRQGGVSFDDLQRVLGVAAGLRLNLATAETYRSPLKFLIAADRADFDRQLEQCASLGQLLGIILLVESEKQERLGVKKSYYLGAESETQFFSILRDAEKEGLEVLLCAPLQEAGDGLSPALIDRIHRAQG